MRAEKKTVYQWLSLHWETGAGWGEEITDWCGEDKDVYGDFWRGILCVVKCKFLPLCIFWALYSWAYRVDLLGGWREGQKFVLQVAGQEWAWDLWHDGIGFHLSVLLPRLQALWGQEPRLSYAPLCLAHCLVYSCLVHMCGWMNEWINKLSKMGETIVKSQVFYFLICGMGKMIITL